MTDTANPTSQAPSECGCHDHGCCPPWLAYLGAGSAFVVAYVVLWFWADRLNPMNAMTLELWKATFTRPTLVFIALGHFLSSAWFLVLMAAGMVLAVRKSRCWGVSVLWGAAILMTLVALGGLICSNRDIIWSIPRHW